MVLLIGGLVYAGHHTPMQDQVIAAYAITWLLLLSGVGRLSSTAPGRRTRRFCVVGLAFLASSGRWRG
jgi:hypothetical protein